MIGTYVLGSTLTDVVANEMVLDLQTSGGTLAPWWDFQVCRAGQLVAVFRNAGTSCFDWPGTAAVSGNLTSTAGFGGPDRERLKLIAAFTSGSPQTVNAGDETVSFTLTINNGATVGTGACAGCLSPTCIVLNSIIVNESPARPVPVQLSNPQNFNFVTWFAGAPNCPGATPTHQSSWGSVKSMYR
jgi:hypothetical protein